MRKSVAILCKLWPMPDRRVDHLAVDLARISLAGDGITTVETQPLGNHRFQTAHARVVASEQFEEASLSASGPLNAAGFQ